MTQANRPAAQVISMARYLARKKIKDELRASGLRLEHFPADIQRAAQAYLEAHKVELIAEAETVLRNRDWRESEIECVILADRSVQKF
jgi:hypothetical protein